MLAYRVGTLARYNNLLHLVAASRDPGPFGSFLTLHDERRCMTNRSFRAGKTAENAQQEREKKRRQSEA